MEQILNLTKFLSPSMLVLFAFTTLVLVILYQWQNKDGKFDLRDILIGEDGKLSVHKSGHATSLLVSTWGFVELVHTGKMTEWYFWGYMGVWGGVNLVRTVMNNGKAQPVPADPDATK